MREGSVGHFNEVRRVQKQRLLMFIQQHPNEKIDKVLALFSLETGMRVSTLKVYLDELKQAELIE